MNQSLEDLLFACMSKPGYQPQDQSELSRSLGLVSRERAHLRQLLRDWEAAGKVVRLSKAKYALRKAEGSGSVEGRIRKLRSGKVLFIPSPAALPGLRALLHADSLVELVVPEFRSGGAMDGDRVLASVRLSVPKGWRRFRKGKPTMDDLQVEVRVDKVLERKRGTWVGVYQPGGRFGYVLGAGQTSPARVKLVEEVPGILLAGQLATVEALSYPKGKMEATGRVTEVLGWPEAEGVDITAVIRKYELQEEFPEEVIAAVSRFSEEIPAEVLAKREDWCDRAVITIDPATARDFDDAIHVRKLEKGWELAVHIADVSHYVQPGSALDAEARRRGNSTYLPDRVLPMLPPKLCDHICSLRPGEKHLTKMCLMQVSEKGKVVKMRFADAVISSHRRFSYEEAAEVLLHGASCGDAEVDAMLGEALTLSRLLRKRRMEAGALDLEFPDVRVLLDAHGHTTGVECEVSDESHQLIEEFMLAANECVASTLKTKSIPTIYRVHEDPDEGKMFEFASLARQYGLKVGDLRKREDLMVLMQELKGHPDESILKLALLRSMMRARYDTKPLGHFGLAKPDYCHFTSPIRRYADLVVHRSLARVIDPEGKAPRLPDAVSLQQAADHISETERNSANAEQEANMLKLYEWLESQCEAEHPQEWEAIVTDARPLGVMVEVPMLQVRGLIPSELFTGGKWWFESFMPRWSNRDGKVLQAGMRVMVVPAKVDRANRWIDWKMARLPE